MLIEHLKIEDDDITIFQRRKNQENLTCKILMMISK